MNSLAANRTVARPLPVAKLPAKHASFVEDLNWPGARPTPDKKAPRRPEVWVPGRDGQWEGITPTLQ